MNLASEFQRVLDESGVDFMVRGMLSQDDKVFPLGTDTKVLSTVFELYARPLIQDIADSFGLRVEEAKQTIYPDFTLLTNPSSRDKIAIDVKTTYRRPQIIFTLGSYTSFLRNNTKNILYPYNHYAEHWILGFVYTREDATNTDYYPLSERGSLSAPYSHVEWFAQEKYKIAGEQPGSGNTTNIGSIRTTNIEDFRQGRGPFAALGEETFRDYWRNFGKTAATRQYSDIRGYQRWKAAQATRR